ncbi:MAG: glycosyltransferase family 4 protein [Thiotrichaceae bacterium]|nr:glycosyltransferase family 4 protein [Thiotrichaceae bacterium]
MIKTKKLKIVHTESSCGWGGQEIRILTESAGMIERGHDVCILCPKESKIYQEALDRGIPVVVLDIARKKVKAIFTVRQWLKENPIDVINTHSSTDSWLVALALRFFKNRPKIVRTRHVSAPISQNLATRWLYTKAANYVVTTGEKLRETLINENGFFAHRIVSIPTGVDGRKFVIGDKNKSRVSLGLPSEKFIVGIVATIRTWKGHEYLIEALAKIDHNNVHLLIVGDGPNLLNIQKKLKEFNLTHVTLAGNQGNVVPWLQSMDLFVLPSYANEGVPQGLIQAMFCGIPVISTTVGSIEELVINNKTGLIVPPKNSDKLADSIEYSLNNTYLLKQFSESALKHVGNKFSYPAMLDAMEEVFYKVL